MGSIWEGRVSRSSGYHGAAGFFLWADPAAFDQAETLARMSLFLDTPLLSAGALKLSGIYDMAESRGIPSCSVLWERGKLSPDRDGPLASTCGAALHRADNSFLVHFLRREDYSQTGLLCQTGSESSLILKALLLYTWNGESPGNDDNPWYTAMENRTGDPVFHGIAGLGYVWAEKPVRWTLSGTIQGQCSPVLLPAYAGYLLLDAEARDWELGISWQENGGNLRNCRGEGADWSRGFSWDGEGRIGDLYLKSRGSLFQPGYLEAGPGVDPRNLSPAGEGSVTLGIPFFFYRREWNEDILDESFVYKDSLCLSYENERWSGKAEGEWRRGDSSWERRIGGSGRWKSSFYFLEGGVDVLWENEKTWTPDTLKWKVKSAWTGFPLGKISLTLKGAGYFLPGGPGELYGELSFESEGF